MMRRLTRFLGRSLLALIVFALSFVLGALLLTQTEPGRDFVRGELETVLHGVLGPEVEIDRMTRIALGLHEVYGEVYGVRLRDAHGVVVASARRISIHLDPFGLLSNHLTFTAATALEPMVDLGDLGGKGGGLPDALVTEPEAAPEPNAEPSAPLIVTFARLHAVSGNLRMRLSGKPYALAELNAVGDIRLAEDVRVRVAQLWGRWRKGGEPRVKVHGSALQYGDSDATPWTATLDLRSARSRSHAHVQAELAALGDAGLRPYRVDAKLDRVTSELLASFGLEAAIDPASGTLQARGALRPDFSAGSLRARLEAAEYAALELPRTEAEGRWSPRVGLSLRRIEARYPQALLDASFQLWPDGRIDLRANVEASELEKLPPVVRFAPGLRGQLRASGRLATDRDDTAHLDANAELEHAGYSGARVRDLHVDVAFDGRDHRDARIEAAIAASDVQSGQLTLDRAQLRVQGGPQRYVANGQLVGYGEHVDRGGIDVLVERCGDHFLAKGNANVAVTEHDRLSAAFHGVDYHFGHELRLAELRASYGSSRARVSDLVFDPEGPSRAAVQASFQQLSAFHTLALDAKLEADLSKREPPARASIAATLQLEGDKAPTRAWLDAGYDSKKLSLALIADDAHGTFLRTHLGTTLERKRVSFAPADVPDLIAKHAWDASLWLAVRRVQDLPGMRALGVPPALFPAFVSADAHVEHVPGEHPEGDLSVRARWKPEAGTAAGLCGCAQHPDLSFSARMREGMLESTGVANIGGRDALHFSTSSRAPLDEWFRPAEPRPASVRVDADRLSLGDVPLVCEQGAGLVSGRIVLERALSNTMKLNAALLGTQLRVGGSAPFDAQVTGELDHSRVVAHAELRSKSGSAHVEARVPMDGGGRIPTIAPNAPVRARADLRNVDVPALLSAVPAVVARHGTLEGRLDVTGPLNDPALYGVLQLHDVTMLLPELGQPFEHVEGRVRLEGRTLYLDDTRVRDREGRADISGKLTLRSLDSLHAELEMKANNLPVRRGGVILARFDGRAKLVADTSPEKTEVAITLRKAAVELTDESLGGVQSLRPNPKVHFVDTAGLKAAREKEAEDAAPTPPTILTIEASEPFWMRRDDFSIQLATHLKVVMQEGEPEVTGVVELERGIISLIGQTFDIQRGRIEFSGGHAIEPTLQLTAVRKVPGGSTVTLEATGTLRKPTLAFLVDDKAVTAGEALAAASGTKTSSNSGFEVEQQVGSVASGIAAGVLTLGARRELGEWVPVLAIENEQDVLRVRAGVEARKFVPKFMRKVVVDAYVEGIVSAPKDGSSSSSPPAPSDASPQTSAAVLLELRFPHDLVGEAEVGSDHWSTDLSWEP